MLILAASPDHNINAFIELIKESECSFGIMSFQEWLNNNQLPTPQGFVYIRVAPEVTLKKMMTHQKSISMEEIQSIYNHHHHFFVTKETLPVNLYNIPTLILNGNINFEDDFSQFYTHLFSIKKFFTEIKEKEDKEKGVYVAPKKKHRGCKC